MGYFPVRYNSRVVIYEHKMFIRLATEGYICRIIIAVKSVHHIGISNNNFIIFQSKLNVLLVLLVVNGLHFSARFCDAAWGRYYKTFLLSLT